MSMHPVLLKKTLKMLSEMRGSGTELVSVYVPPNYAITEVATQLSNEASQASNIKSKQTRKNVQGALQRIIGYFKAINYRIPPNGMAVFSGSLERDAGTDKIELFVIEPPQPIRSRIYQCDSRFFLEPLMDQLKSDEVYGLVVMDNKEATVAVMAGKSYQVKWRDGSTVPSKVRAGGQSARRFSQLREIAIHDFHKEIAEKMNEILVPLQKELKGIIVGGPGSTKDEFIAKDLLNHMIRDKVMGTLNTGYTDEYGIKELINASGELLKEASMTKERKALEKFMKEVVTSGLATYGPKEVWDAMERSQAESLLISEECPWVHVLQTKCNKCQATGKPYFRKETDDTTRKCGSCGKEDSKLEVLAEKRLDEELIELAEKAGTKVELISSQTEEGKQFLEAFGGVGTILRYKL